jgi:phosphohistidine phosphatase SixA
MFSQIVLLRHATRSAVLDFSESIAGGGSSLNATGLGQAEDFAQIVKKGGGLPPPNCLFASPKLRARQTLQPLSKATGIALEILDALDERRDSESLKTFEERVRQIPTLLNGEGQGTIYLCTHLDVLEAASALWPTNFTERESTNPWSTLEYQVFNVKNGVFESALRGRIEPRNGRL